MNNWNWKHLFGGAHEKTTAYALAVEQYFYLCLDGMDESDLLVDEDFEY
jgi:hypothetical protein